MFQIRTGLALFVTLALLLPSAAQAQEPTVPADSFVDSVGVNLHLHYFGTPYDQFSLVRSKLVELGIRHVRDGLVDTEWADYYARFDSLAQAGIKATFIVTPEQSTELWASYPARMPRAFEAYEAPNELNRFGTPGWQDTLRHTLGRMRTLRNDPRSAAFPVIGPSLSTGEAYHSLGDISAWVDVGNLHNYMGGRHPGTTGWSDGGYGSIAWNIGNVRPYIGPRPIIATENGYHGTHNSVDSVPQEVAGRYMPRLLMEQFRAGIAKTFIYELIDWHGREEYGLLNPDFSPKPAFRSVKALLNLLADPGPPFTPQTLGYSVQGGAPNVRQMVFQKRNGTYFLAVWLESEAFSQETRQHVAVAPRRVTISTALPWRHTRTHHWQHDGSMSTTNLVALVGTHTIPVDLSDAVTVIELAPPLLGGLLPGVPLDLSVAVQDRDVLLRWQTPADGGAPSGFTLEAGTSLNMSQLVSIPVGAITQLHVPNVPAGLYFVRVRATNATGEGAPSNVVQFAIGVPEPPQLVVSQGSANPISLAWSPAAGASHYVLSAGTSPDASDVAVVPVGTATQVTGAVSPGVRYYVRVAAVNALGASRSNEVSVIVGGAQQPGAPTLHAQVSGRHVALSWAPGAGGAVDNFALVAGTSPGAADIGVFPVGQTTQLSVDSPVGGTFYVRVYAQNAVGVASSNEVTLSIP